MYQCNICKLEYGRRDHLLRHQKIKHNEFQYNCDICSYGCNKKSILIRHFENAHNFMSSTTSMYRIIYLKKNQCWELMN